MTKVDRYDFRSKHHGAEVVVKSREGKWVKAADYDALTAERDAVHEAWKQAVLEFDKKCREANKHYARAESAEAENARLRTAAKALGAMPEGSCFCSKNRIGDNSKTHEPECADLRAALTGKETK
jgi:hypothetical protein